MNEKDDANELEASGEISNERRSRKNQIRLVVVKKLWIYEVQVCGASGGRGLEVGRPQIRTLDSDSSSVCFRKSLWKVRVSTLYGSFQAYCFSIFRYNLIRSGSVFHFQM